MLDCKSIFQRLKLSPDERLQTYVNEHDIVDIALDSTEFLDNEDSVTDTDEEEGVELGDDAFPELAVNEDEVDGGGDDDDGGHHGLDDRSDGLDDTGFIEGGGNYDNEGHHGLKFGYDGLVDPGMVDGGGDDHDGGHVDVSSPTSSPPVVLCQVTLDSPRPVVLDADAERLTYRVSEYSTFTVQQAWDHGNIA